MGREVETLLNSLETALGEAFPQIKFVQSRPGAQDAPDDQVYGVLRAGNPRAIPPRTRFLRVEVDVYLDLVWKIVDAPTESRFHPLDILMTACASLHNFNLTYAADAPLELAEFVEPDNDNPAIEVYSARLTTELEVSTQIDQQGAEDVDPLSGPSLTPPLRGVYLNNEQVWERGRDES